MGKKSKILVVDDEDRNLRLMEAILLPQGYDVILAADGEETLTKAQEIHPDVILLDVMMPGLDGFEVAKRLKDNAQTQIIPIVMVTALKEVEDRIRALEAGADDFLSKPVDKTELKTRVQTLVKVKAYNDHMRNYQKELKTEVNKKTKALKKAIEKVKSASLEAIYRLSRAAEYKDEDTGAHLQRMSNYSAIIALQMDLDSDVVESILHASPMHDVGKIGIPDKILLKPGKFIPNEWEIMKKHATMGTDILRNSDFEFLQMGEVIARSHHEKWDGSGYPRGLKGEEIPLSGRIVAIADVFDALTSKRPYKEPFPLEKSFAIIEESRGTHFDPVVVDAFFAVKEGILGIKEQYQDQAESLFMQLAGEGT